MGVGSPTSQNIFYQYSFHGPILLWEVPGALLSNKTLIISAYGLSIAIIDVFISYTFGKKLCRCTYV